MRHNTLLASVFGIRRQTTRRLRLALGVGSWALVVAAWFVLTYLDVLPPFSLPKPVGVIRAFGMLWTDYNLLGNVFQS